MKSTGIWYIVAVCGAAAFLGSSLTSGSAQVMPLSEFPYQTGCSPVDGTTVEGFVTNPGTTLIRIDGMVRFTFTTANSMSRPSLQVMGSGLVPPGRTLSVARTRLAWDLLPNESCQFDITGAVR
ncbi:MAG: hypothetical protein Q7J64_05095 [Elusimicrobiota bacterium]|nr:hypothetical protein [Elusimicrobiota bacterium]